MCWWHSALARAETKADAVRLTSADASAGRAACRSQVAHGAALSAIRGARMSEADVRPPGCEVFGMYVTRLTWPCYSSNVTVSPPLATCDGDAHLSRDDGPDHHHRLRPRSASAAPWPGSLSPRVALSFPAVPSRSVDVLKSVLLSRVTSPMRLPSVHLVRPVSNGDLHPTRHHVVSPRPLPRAHQPSQPP